MSLLCTLRREVEVVLRRGMWLGEHMGVSVGCGESGARWFLRAMGKILYYWG